MTGVTGAQTKILLVENREDDFVIARRLLEEIQGGRYHLDWIPDFEGALAALAAQQYDACLVGYRLEGRDGIQFIRQAIAAGSHSPLILLIDQEDHEVDLAAMAAGAADFLTKTRVSGPLLERSIRYSIQQKRTEEALRRMQQELTLRVEERTAELQQANEALQGEIIERRQAESRLRRSQRDLSDFFDNAALGLHWAGPDGLILRANQAELDLLGYQREEYVGHYLSEFHVNPQLIDDVFARLRLGETVANFECQLRRKDGSTKDVFVTSNVYWEDGRFDHTRSFTRDISQRKSAERALREAARRKDEFLAMLGHELRNPLAAICNAAAVLQIVEGCSREAEQAHRAMDRQIENMRRLLDDLLDVARVTQGKIRLDKQIIDLGEIVRRAIGGSRAFIENRRHEMNVLLSDEHLALEADPTRLDQVLTNLLNNAAKFTEPGGQISIVAQREGNEAVLRIRDTGVGMTLEMLDQAFDLFVQSERSLDRSQGGLGIGLTMVKSLVEMHGGSVIARSEGLGKGSEFVVRLPALAVGHPRRQVEPASNPRPGGPGCRVLVVEDNRDTAGMLTVLLNGWGYSARTAYDGPAAVQLARDFRPEVVLLDIGLPRMDGYEVARRLREDVEADKLLLIALTGYGQDEDRRRTDEAGFDHHLLKPVTPLALKNLLANAYRPPRGPM